MITIRVNTRLVVCRQASVRTVRDLKLWLVQNVEWLTEDQVEKMLIFAQGDLERPLEETREFSQDQNHIVILIVEGFCAQLRTQRVIFFYLN